MNKQMIISVMAKDRPGIIAEVTGAIFELGGDLADLNQSILSGYLNMILAVNFDETVTTEDVLAKFSDLKTKTDFEISIKELDTPIETTAILPPVETYIVTAQGANKSGLVHGISKFCRDLNINILDLSTKLADGQYTMVLQLDLHNVHSVGQVQTELASFADQTGLNVTIQHNDIFKATHEVTLR